MGWSDRHPLDFAELTTPARQFLLSCHATPAPRGGECIRSEQQLQRELDLPRGRGRIGNLAGRLAIAVVRGVALEDDPIRVREIRAIEHIERFGAELQRLALPDGYPLEEGRVDAEQARAAERTASRVPEGSGGRHREGTGIKPVVDSP